MSEPCTCNDPNHDHSQALTKATVSLDMPSAQPPDANRRGFLRRAIGGGTVAALGSLGASALANAATGTARTTLSHYQIPPPQTRCTGATSART